MAVIFLPADVRRTIQALYGPPGWTATLDRCLDMLVPEYGLAQPEIPGRLQALAMAGHNREALFAVALAFGIGPEVPRKEVPMLQPQTPRKEVTPIHNTGPRKG